MSYIYIYICVWPQAARLLRSWVRIPPTAWILVCCECRVLSGRGLCDELITRPEESYRLCCVVVCDLETSRMGAPYIYDFSRLRVNLTPTRVVSTLRCLILNVWWSKIHCYNGQIRPWTIVAVIEVSVTLFGLGLSLLLDVGHFIHFVRGRECFVLCCLAVSWRSSWT